MKRQEGILTLTLVFPPEANGTRSRRFIGRTLLSTAR